MKVLQFPYWVMGNSSVNKELKIIPRIILSLKKHTKNKNNKFQ